MNERMNGRMKDCAHFDLLPTKVTALPHAVMHDASVDIYS